MKDEHMLMYALVFVLGLFMVSRMMGGRLIEGTINQNGFPDGHVGCLHDLECYHDNCDKSRTYEIFGRDIYGKCKQVV